MSALYIYSVQVSGTPESVDQFQKDLVDEDWFVDLNYKTSDDKKDYKLVLKASRGDLVEAIDRATTNRDLVMRSEIDVQEEE